MVVSTGATAVPPFLLSVRTLGPALRDDMADASLAQHCPTARIAVALIEVQLVGALARPSASKTRHPYRVEYLFERLAVAALAFGENEP